MVALSKKQKAVAEKHQLNQVHSLDAALEIVLDCATAKFVESVDVAVVLGIEARQSDQTVRGALMLPHGTGRKVRVAVFASGEQADAATAAGADLVGMEDLAERVMKGEMNFDVVVAAPDAMRVVGRLGQVLGPRGLMPNPKVGTVTPDVAGAVKKAKAGQVRFRNDKAGIVHSTIGKANFKAADLAENCRALITGLNKLKPASSKGIYVKKVTVSSTMGPGVQVERGDMTK